MDVSQPVMTSPPRLFRSLEEVESIWLRLEAEGHGSPFQSLEFVRSALTHLHADGTQTPLIALWSDGDRPTFLVPLLVRRLGPLRLATFPGDSHATSNFGVGRPPAGAFAGLRSALKAEGIDLVVLKDQPRIASGNNNPVLADHTLPSPNPSFETDLSQGFEAVIARNGGRKKHRLRNKLKATAEGHLPQLKLARTPDEKRAWLKELLDRKALRFAERGLPDVFSDVAVRRFYDDLAPALEIHALVVGDEKAALLALGCFGTRRHLLVNAYDPAYARMSPGESLLHLTLESCAANGVTDFDFGPGWERYKEGWSDRAVELAESIVGLTVAGRVVASLIRNWRRLRARLARSERVKTALQRLRAFARR